VSASGSTVEQYRIEGCKRPNLPIPILHRSLAGALESAEFHQEVEMAIAEAMFRQPGHPYTGARLRAAPLPDPPAPSGDVALSGEVGAKRHFSGKSMRAISFDAIGPTSRRSPRWELHGRPDAPRYTRCG
jgi:hypothetical protein